MAVRSCAVAPRTSSMAGSLWAQPLGERFFTTAGSAVLAELRAFLTAEGVHPATALGWFTDSLGFGTYHPGPGE